MKYNKSLGRKIVSQNKKIGEVLFLDGLCDVTDPCYDKDTWCALHNVKIMPGVYSAFIDEVNYPEEYTADSFIDEVRYNVKRGEKFISDDIRIMALTIVHKEYVTNSQAISELMLVFVVFIITSQTSKKMMLGITSGNH